jgi:hypothetical protein
MEDVSKHIFMNFLYPVLPVYLSTNLFKLENWKTNEVC